MEHWPAFLLPPFPACSKVLGAGGGGFLLFAAAPGRRARVADALEAAGAPCTLVEFDFRGVHW
jgi:galactokinase/mevalonate kinase-like predicted kinase